MASKLNDDVIYEIIARLPIKNAVLCLSLNKTFYKYISSPDFTKKHAAMSTKIFHFSARNPKIFSVLDCPVTGKIPTCTNLAAEASILDSCNGVFLLSVLKRYYLFNPLNGGIRAVGYEIENHHDVGLAVEASARSFSGYDFKLVTIDIKKPKRNITLMKFGELVVPSEANRQAAVRPRAELGCRFFSPAPDRNMRPVYDRGCLHWIGEDGRSVAVYDVAEVRARFARGPIMIGGDDGFVSGADKWFGLASGSLHFIYALRDEIVVHAHDNNRGVWRVAHRIQNISKPENNSLRNGVVAGFDGRRVFLHLRLKERDGEIHAHDLATGAWRKSGARVKVWADWNQVFVAYDPSFARVSDEYLPGLLAAPARQHRQRMLAFAGLQALLLDDHVAPKHIELEATHFSLLD